MATLKPVGCIFILREKILKTAHKNLKQGCQNSFLKVHNPTVFSHLLGWPEILLAFLPGRTKNPAGLWSTRTGFWHPDRKKMLDGLIFFLNVFAAQDHGPVCLCSTRHWQVRAWVFQRYFPHHHVRGTAQRGPHPQAVHGHLPGPRDGRIGPRGGHVRQADLPLQVSRDYDQVDQREDAVNLTTVWTSAPQGETPFGPERLLNTRGPTLFSSSELWLQRNSGSVTV